MNHTLYLKQCVNVKILTSYIGGIESSVTYAYLLHSYLLSFAAALRTSYYKKGDTE